MPTIDQLENVVVSSDDDMLPVSQSGTARRVSRSQLLAGTQPILSLNPGILGRSSPGLGPPQQITVGAGLSLADGVLSGPPHYSVASLQTSSTVKLTDLVPLGQNGRDNAVSIKTLLSASGVDVSNQTVITSNGLHRRLGDWLSDAVAVEAFGACGDGVTDDTGAISQAIASGRPVLLGPKTYRVDGQWNVQSPATLIGTAGMTVLRRVSQTGGAWINITASDFTSIGVTFDAGGIVGDSWGVLVAPGCIRTSIQNCSFKNATGKAYGTGLVIQARDGLSGHGSTHWIVGCRFENNTCHGIWVQAASDATISHCQAWGNGLFGICLDFNDPQFSQTVRQSSVFACRCWNNSRGISIGNYNALNTEPPRWGLENPDALDINVWGNICSDNSAYGIAVSGKRIQVCQNQIFIGGGSPLASGILCNASVSTLAENSIVGPGTFGIDAGGSADTAIKANVIADFAIGINAGGSTRINVSENKLSNNARAITLSQVETDGNGSNFGVACSDIWIEDNLIQIGVGSGGIFLFDGPERVEITRNRFFSSAPSNAPNLCWAHSDSVWIRENTLNGSPGIVVDTKVSDGSTGITYPDMLDQAEIAASITSIEGVFGLHQLAMAGQISFVRVSSGGQGYTRAKVIFSGSGMAAAAIAYLRDGVVIGIALSAGGFGYDSATTSASIVGDGTGASVQPIVGLPVPQNRRVSLRCRSPVHFAQGIAGGIRDNWTKTDFTVAAGSEVVLQAVDGAWQAVAFENIDYLQPGGDGSVSIKSVQGDIRLDAASGGGVRFISENEQSGFRTYLGRGSPEGEIIAPPGSDYRNLNGGIGSTLWLKRIGTDSSGWFAVA